MRYIYLYTNKITDEKYVGQTSDPRRRRYEHKSYHGGCKQFHSAIKKYGYENFDFEILFEGDEKEIDFNAMEKLYIEQYKSNIEGIGYNSPNALPHSYSYDYSKLSESIKGRKLSNATKEKMHRSSKRIRLIMDGIEFDSIVAAANYFNLDRRCLAYCIKRNSTNTYKNHKFTILN